MVECFFLLNEQLQIIIAIVVIYFCINFVLSTINVILIADQRPAESSARTLVQQILSLIVIYVLTQVTQKDELLYLSLAFCGIPLLISLYYNVLLFKLVIKPISLVFLVLINHYIKNCYL